MTTVAIIVAAGRGTRAGGEIPKQWQVLGSQTVAAHALTTFARHPLIDQIILVTHPDELEMQPWPKELPLQVVVGGTTRRASVLAGLEAAEGIATQVLIHDAARPLVTHDIIDAVLNALTTHAGAAPAVAVTDTLWHGASDVVTGLQDRAGLYRAQTPQGFHLAPLLAARAAKLMGQNMDVRCGNGYDVHRFGPGDHVWLCGVKIPHGRGLQGHSDADVGMHAVTDAIYGALGMGDIGQHFPPSDPQWKGAKSHIFLTHAKDLAAQQGYQISNVDCTLVCEHPKIGPHQTAMKSALAAIIGLPADRISVKATTSERLGFTGREEGIASIATATLVKS